MAYDNLFMHWGVRLRKAKSKVLVIDVDPMEVKQEEKDYQRALLGDECDECDNDDVVIIDDPYLDPMFTNEVDQGDDCQGADKKGEECDVKGMEKEPVGPPRENDDVSCMSSPSSVNVASINLRMQQIKSPEISNRKQFSNFLKDFQNYFKKIMGYCKCRGPMIFSFKPPPAQLSHITCAAQAEVG